MTTAIERETRAKKMVWMKKYNLLRILEIITRPEGLAVTLQGAGGTWRR